MSGSFPVVLSKRKVRNYSLSWSPSSNSIGDKHPQLMSNFQFSICPSTTTITAFKPRNFKRTRVDVEVTKSSGDHFENTKLPLTKKVSQTNLSTPNDESPQCCWKKPDSVNTPYYNRNSRSNYAAVGGQKLDSSVNRPQFRPYDICFHRRRNHALIGATLPVQNKGSRIEIQEEWTKGSVLRPGMVLLKKFISHDEQVLHFNSILFCNSFYNASLHNKHFSTLYCWIVA